MPQSHRRAGQNIRKLALKRRLKAVQSWVAAGLVIVLPLFLVKTFDDLVKHLPAATPSTAASWHMPPYFYAGLGVIALGLVANGMSLWQQANNADQGAKGEEDSADALEVLKPEGWQIDYNLILGNGLGDADILCISPQRQAYVIDVKSHRGFVTTDGMQLYRRKGTETLPFEKDFLARAMQQALQVKKQKGLKFVTPIVAFSAAKVSVPQGKVQKVYVVEKAKLADLLRSLG
ncbi:MAG TPA: nuclease-related domain-containing protein [Coleofasciculaceae cyanobacterium]